MIMIKLMTKMLIIMKMGMMKLIIKLLMCMIVLMMGLKMILLTSKVGCSHVHSRSQNVAQEEEQVVRPGHLATAEQEIERFERKFILPLQSSLVAPCSYIRYHRGHFSRMTAGTGPRAVLTRATQAL